MSNDLVIRNMTRSEVDELVCWAALEGWNPGLHDADAFWATDPDAYIAAELDGEMIGGGAITSYHDEFGFMGFFIVRPEFRGHGFGNQLWHARRNRLLGRLKAGASIGMDGVFNMQDYYAKGGFVFSHRDIRFRTDIPHGTTAADADANIERLANIPFADLLTYDRSCFPAPRPEFLRAWVSLPESLALAYRCDDRLQGYGVIRRCGEGCKIGPLFADNAQIAEALYQHLSAFSAGAPLFLDVPENNPAAIAMAEKHAMDEVFGCARMYLGGAPDLAHEKIFGVSTFELG
ncbi:Acetyltransferase (GNAT) domain-containing protein [Mariprofundus ferrinatatus]|uniref:Acetyltransferase (GNAT) domain-containing protein n=1 Tax=Mariprofundus ferrinatatus TaxID=1921087 RepID=A0A2K8L6Y7_9PROT|nr:GNAT family N-acetyltransferase [Mariprofundus ferrinatatus]ATX81611.1 Acetyltransferase (GNAT) domain-containing protein [Mariprofundus ferrinatatus]